ncbi:YqeB family protein [Streptomyces sp. P9-A2]|uniref:YqeB family protein n=1 Tax=Streptomyces sp. P9-A2 TaxID=3072284 RepID=UPI002FC77052
MDMHKRPEQDPQGDRLTMLGEPAWRTVCVYIVFVLAGAGVGWLVGFLADWLVTLPWAPLQGPAELVASIPAPGLPAAGSVAGLALGLVAQHEQLVIRLSGDRVVLTRKGRAQEFSHDAIAAVFRDGKQLVLLGHEGGELTRQECDLDMGRVADAFAEHGYVWADADPHKDEFRRWVPDTPGLPEGANAILRARQESLEKKSPSDDDVRELREELARLGVVVRDEKRRQYWRTFREAGPAVE